MAELRCGKCGGFVAADEADFPKGLCPHCGFLVKDGEPSPVAVLEAAEAAEARAEAAVAAEHGDLTTEQADEELAREAEAKLKGDA